MTTPTDYDSLDDAAICALAAAGDPVAMALVSEIVNVYAAYLERIVAAWDFVHAQTEAA